MGRPEEIASRDDPWKLDLFSNRVDRGGGEDTIAGGGERCVHSSMPGQDDNKLPVCLLYKTMEERVEIGPDTPRCYHARIDTDHRHLGIA